MKSVAQTVLQYWVKPLVSGEELGCQWSPRGPNVPRGSALLWIDAMKFRPEQDLEGVVLTPDWWR